MRYDNNEIDITRLDYNQRLKDPEYEGNLIEDVFIHIDTY